MINLKNFLHQEKPIIGLTSLGLSNPKNDTISSSNYTSTTTQNTQLFKLNTLSQQQNTVQQSHDSLENLFNSNFKINFNNEKITG